MEGPWNEVGKLDGQEKQAKGHSNAGVLVWGLSVLCGAELGV